MIDGKVFRLTALGHLVEFFVHEKDLPAFEDQASEKARFPRSEKNSGRASYSPAAAQKRAEETHPINTVSAGSRENVPIHLKAATRQRSFGLRGRRIRKSPEVRRILGQGEKVGCRFFRVAFLESRDRRGKVAFVVLKRVVRKASRRNRFKRILREFYRLNRTRLKEGYDFVFELVKDPEERDWNYQETEQMLLPALRGAGLLKVA